MNYSHVNKTILYSNSSSNNEISKINLIILILSIIFFLSLIGYIYIFTFFRKKKEPNIEPELSRNAIIKNDIYLEDVYLHESNKKIVSNPLIKI